MYEETASDHTVEESGAESHLGMNASADLEIWKKHSRNICPRANPLPGQRGCP
jgi:hypothetical protein